MRIVGDVVGDRGDLRLGARVAPQREIVRRVVVGDHLRHADVAVFADRLAVRIGQRPVVLDDAFERFPGEIEAVEGRVAPLDRGDDAQGLRVVVEAAEVGEAGVERTLARMPERRMAEVVGERQRLGQILVEPERARERPGDLRDFERVGQAGAVMVALVEHEHLGLVLEPAERGRMDDAVGIAPERPNASRSAARDGAGRGLPPDRPRRGARFTRKSRN